MITFIDSVSGMSSTFYVQGNIPGARDVLLNVTESVPSKNLQLETEGNFRTVLGVQWGKHWVLWQNGSERKFPAWGRDWGKSWKVSKSRQAGRTDKGGGLVFQAVLEPRGGRARGTIMRQHVVQYGWTLSGHGMGRDQKPVREARFPSWKVFYAMLRIVAFIVDALASWGRTFRRECSRRLRTYSVVLLYSKLQLTLLNTLNADNAFDSRFDLGVRCEVGGWETETI